MQRKNKAMLAAAIGMVAIVVATTAVRCSIAHTAGQADTDPPAASVEQPAEQFRRSGVRTGKQGEHDRRQRQPDGKSQPAMPRARSLLRLKHPRIRPKIGADCRKRLYRRCAWRGAERAAPSGRNHVRRLLLYRCGSDRTWRGQGAPYVWLWLSGAIADAGARIATHRLWLAAFHRPVCAVRAASGVADFQPDHGF